MLRALDHLHTERRAIHRDVKAANILLTRDGGVKLADLGAAAAARDAFERGVAMTRTMVRR